MPHRNGIAGWPMRAVVIPSWFKAAAAVMMTMFEKRYVLAQGVTSAVTTVADGAVGVTKVRCGWQNSSLGDHSTNMDRLTDRVEATKDVISF